MYVEAPGFRPGPRGEALSKFAFNFNLRRYDLEGRPIGMTTPTVRRCRLTPG